MSGSARDLQLPCDPIQNRAVRRSRASVFSLPVWSRQASAFEVGEGLGLAEAAVFDGNRSCLRNVGENPPRHLRLRQQRLQAFARTSLFRSSPATTPGFLSRFTFLRLWDYVKNRS
jgi:hypothetical protein